MWFAEVQSGVRRSDGECGGQTSGENMFVQGC